MIACRPSKRNSCEAMFKITNDSHCDETVCISQCHEISKLYEELLSPKNGMSILYNSVNCPEVIGVGKSSHLLSVCKHSQVRSRYDHIYWVSLQLFKPDVDSCYFCLQRLANNLRKDISKLKIIVPNSFRSSLEAIQFINIMLNDQRCLLVVDDVSSGFEMSLFGSIQASIVFATRDFKLARDFKQHAKLFKFRPCDEQFSVGILASVLPNDQITGPMMRLVLSWSKGCSLKTVLIANLLRNHPKSSHVDVVAIELANASLPTLVQHFTATLSHNHRAQLIMLGTVQYQCFTSIALISELLRGTAGDVADRDDTSLVSVLLHSQLVCYVSVDHHDCIFMHKEFHKCLGELKTDVVSVERCATFNLTMLKSVVALDHSSFLSVVSLHQFAASCSTWTTTFNLLDLLLNEKLTGVSGCDRGDAVAQAAFVSSSTFQHFHEILSITATMVDVNKYCHHGCSCIRESEKWFEVLHWAIGWLQRVELRVLQLSCVRAVLFQPSDLDKDDEYSQIDISDDVEIIDHPNSDVMLLLLCVVLQLCEYFKAQQGSELWRPELHLLACLCSFELENHSDKSLQNLMNMNYIVALASLARAGQLVDVLSLCDVATVIEMRAMPSQCSCYFAEYFHLQILIIRNLALTCVGKAVEQMTLLVNSLHETCNSSCLGREVTRVCHMELARVFFKSLQLKKSQRCLEHALDQELICHLGQMDLTSLHCLVQLATVSLHAEYYNNALVLSKKVFDRLRSTKSAYHLLLSAAVIITEALRLMKLEEKNILFLQLILEEFHGGNSSFDHVRLLAVQQLLVNSDTWHCSAHLELVHSLCSTLCTTIDINILDFEWARLVCILHLQLARTLLRLELYQEAQQLLEHLFVIFSSKFSSPGCGTRHHQLQLLTEIGHFLMDMGRPLDADLIFRNVMLSASVICEPTSRELLQYCCVRIRNVELDGNADGNYHALPTLSSWLISWKMLDCDGCLQWDNIDGQQALADQSSTFGIELLRWREELFLETSSCRQCQIPTAANAVCKHAQRQQAQLALYTKLKMRPGAVVKLQSIVRKLVCRRNALALTRQVTRIQSIVRMYLAVVRLKTCRVQQLLSHALRLHNCATKLQLLVRSYLAKKRVKWLKLFASMVNCLQQSQAKLATQEFMTKYSSIVRNKSV